MYQYSYMKQVNSARLMNEIKAAGLSTVDHIDTFGATLSIYFTTSLSAPQKSNLDTVVSSHLLQTTREAIDNILEGAMAFGNSIIRDFVAENIMLGITQLGLTNHVRKTLREVKDAILSGSLYDTISEIRSLDPEDFDATILTPARILLFRNKIETYLQVPLATAWNDPETWTLP